MEFIKQLFKFEEKLLYLDEYIKELPHCCVKCGSEEKLKKYKKIAYSRIFRTNLTHKFSFRASIPLTVLTLCALFYSLEFVTVVDEIEQAFLFVICWSFNLLIAFSFFRKKFLLSYYICKKCLRPRRILYFITYIMFFIGCYLIYKYFAYAPDIKSDLLKVIYFSTNEKTFKLGAWLILIAMHLQIIFFFYLYRHLRVVALTENNQKVIKGCGKEVLENFKDY